MWPLTAFFEQSVHDVRQYVRAYRGADVVSDHNLMIAKILLKLSRTDKKGARS